MKKYVLLFIFCLLIFALKVDSYASDAIPWLNQTSGSMCNDVGSLYSVEIRNISTDHWLLVGYEDPSSGFLIISDQPFTVEVRYFYSSYSNWRSFSSSFVGDNLCIVDVYGIAGLGLNLVWDVPYYRGSVSSLKSALVNFGPSIFEGFPAPDYVFDSNLGYLTGIAERSSILDVLKDKNNVIGSDVEQFNRVFKIGWGSSTSTGIDLSGSDKYDDLQVQAKIKVYGRFVSSITGDLTRGIPDVDEYHDFDYIPADSYSMRFELLDDLQFWFIDFFNYVYSDAKFLEKPVVMADLYLRVLGTNLLNDDICAGPWVKVTFYVMNGVGKSDTHVVVTGGVEFDDNGNLVVDSTSPYGDGLSADFGYGSGLSESDAYNNLIRDSENRLNVTFESLMKDVGNLPAIMSKLFSFLPSWCLNLLSLAFSLSIVILIWKVAT